MAAWLELRGGEQLLLEVCEDFAIRSADVATAVQVKSSRAASGPTSYSLQSVDVCAALRRFWERATECGDLECYLIFIANGGASNERKHSFPDNMPGLLYWQRAAGDGDTAPIRLALSALFRDEPLGEWLDGNPSDKDLREKLLKRVRWALDAVTSVDLTEQLRDEIGALFPAGNIPVIAADEAIRALLDRVFEAACEPLPEQRGLTHTDLRRAIETSLAPIALSQMMTSSSGPETGDTIHSVLVTEVRGAPSTFTHRPDTVTEILNSARGNTVVWLHGSHGVGKSTLAKLLAQRIGGRWVLLDLRPVQKDINACLATWRELVRVSSVGTIPKGVILDDVAASATEALRSRIVALAQTFAGRGARVIVTSPQAPSPGRLLELGSSAGAVIQSPYFSESEILDLISGPGAPSEDSHRIWATFIRLATGGGHPLLTASKVVSLRARAWPDAALTEDFGPAVSDAVRSTRDEARQQLLNDLSSLDNARSIEAGKLLRRIVCVFDRVDDALARKLAAADPIIENAGDALAVLRGTWLEMLPEGDFRVSPLIGDLANDIASGDIESWRQIAAQHWFMTKILNERTLPLCFWNAFLGNHVWVLLKLCEVLQTLPHKRLVSAASLLSPLTAFATDRSLYPGEPMIAEALRLLQFDVADVMEQGELAGEIASRLLVEIDEVPNDEVRSALTIVAAYKVLNANFAETTYEDRLEFALRLRRETPRVLAISDGSIADPAEDILKDLDERVDLAGLLFSQAISRIRSSEDLFALVQALDKLSPSDRNSFIDAADIMLAGLSALVHRGWSRDQLANKEMAEPDRYYEKIYEIVGAWDRVDMMIELACARSVIRDEGLSDIEGALTVIDDAISSFGNQPALVRQKAKVLGHAGCDEEAARLLVTIEDEVGGRSSFDRALALRDGGVSAARARLFSDARRLFTKASDAIAAGTGFDALKVGLMVEYALASWEYGDHASALKKLGDAFEILESIPATDARQDEHAHQVSRLAVGRFMNDVRNFHRAPKQILDFGQASALTADDDVLNLDLKPLADNWRILALVELEAGVDAGIEQRSLTKQDDSGVVSIESSICLARYERSLTSGPLDQIFRNGIDSASARFVSGKTTAPSGEIARVNRSELVSCPVQALLANPGTRETILSIPVDVLLWIKFGGEPQPGLLDRLARACREAFGRDAAVDHLLEVASGVVPVGPSGSLSIVTAAAIAMSDDEIASKPSARFRRDLYLVGYVSMSMARKVFESVVVQEISAGWRNVLENQRFLLVGPAVHCPNIETEIEGIFTSGFEGAARLILAAAPAVGYTLDTTWEEILTGVGVVSTES